jgi:hypothetical protein
MVAKCTQGRIATNGCVSAGHAIAYNIELGLLVRSADAAGRIDGYIRGLIERGDLVQVERLGS